MKSTELKGKKIVIAPFNTESVFLYHQLMHDGIEVIAFMDADFSLHNSDYMGTMIIPYFHFEKSDVVVVISKLGYASYDEIYKELIDCNYSDNELIRQKDIEFSCDFKDITDDIDMQGLSKIRNLYWLSLLKSKMHRYSVKNGLIIHELSMYITTRCSLKCNGCCALMDFFRPGEQKDMDLQDSIQSFDLLMKNIDFVDVVVLIGGETFLYKDIDKLLIHIASSKYIKKIGQIELVTNGTILPAKSTLEILGNNRHIFLTRISDYGKLSSKKLSLVSFLNKYNCFYSNTVRNTWYLSNQPIVPADDLTEDEIRQKCSNCDCLKGGRLRIVGNKIYTCHFVAFAAECHAVPQDKRDYLDINTDCISKENLQKFMDEIHPGQAYCSAPYNIDCDENILLPVGEQVSSVNECVRYDE